MLTTSILINKREGRPLDEEEIRFLVDGFCDGSVTDYQMAAFAMAVCINGMTQRETVDLTNAMFQSGDVFSRLDATAPNHRRPRIDKHSTGGLGDKVSLILAPLLAEVGADVPMISGRGLGLTGGTLDKLDSIPGFRSRMTIQQSNDALRDAGAFIVGASEFVAPADRKLYSLRDVTGTVESIPLITASILSKKMAANLDALVMDVKVGQAAAMKSLPDAIALSQSLIQVGQKVGLPTSVIISDMDQPLGFAVGNALEVIEAIEVLCGGGPSDVRTLTIELAADLMARVGLATTMEDAKERLAAAIDSGRAMERFQRMIACQGGDLSTPIEVAPAHPLVASCDGFLSDVDCQLVGAAVVAMGGGRQKMDDLIDAKVGIKMHCKIGDQLTQGQPVMSIHCQPNDSAKYQQVLADAFSISASPVSHRRLIMRRLSEKDFDDDADCLGD